MRTIAFLALTLAAGFPVADHLGRELDAQRQRDRVPGLSFAVVRHQRIVRQGGFGVANLEWHAAADGDTKFELASISKMFAGAAARILIEEGKLDAEAEIGRYLADLPDGWRGIRVRHLITMSSGLPEDFASDIIPYDQDVVAPSDEPSMLRAFATLRFASPVGARFVYSGPNYALLGMIVRTVAGMPYQDFVRDRIFTPAGMRDSSFIDNSAVVLHRASGYRRTAAGELRQGWYLGQYLHSRADVGVLSTAPDLARWVIALEQRKIVRRPEALWEPTVSDTGTPLDYAYGWWSDTWLGHRRQSHSGGYRTGFHTFVARYPDDDLAIVVLTNCDFSNVRDYVNTIARAFITDAPDPATEANTADAAPSRTTRIAAAITSLQSGRLDETVMFPDAIEPVGIDELRGFLAGAGPFAYAGRRVLNGRPLHVHGHSLVEYVTLRTVIQNHATYVTAYLDESGRIAYLELTN